MITRSERNDVKIDPTTAVLDDATRDLLDTHVVVPVGLLLQSGQRDAAIIAYLDREYPTLQARYHALLNGHLGSDSEDVAAP